MSLPEWQPAASSHSQVVPCKPSFMACYNLHNRIIRFMRIMSHGENDVCIFPSLILPWICMETYFCEPVYIECSEERFRFQFTAHVKADVRSSSGDCSDFKATGFSFREKGDAIESASLAALEFLLYRYGINSDQYTDFAFTEHWPLYDPLSEHSYKSRSRLSELTDEFVSLVKSIERSFKLFEDSRSLVDADPVFSPDISLLDGCLNELQNIHGFLSSDIRSCTELQRLCLFNRRDNRDCHEAVWRRLTETNVKVRCSSTLKLTLDKVCECAGYSVESIYCHRISDKFYVCEILLLNESASNEHDSHLQISSGKCLVSSEAHRCAYQRAILAVCRSGGYKIIDPGYIFARDMQRDIHALKYELPFLCNFAVKLKDIVQRGFKSTDIVAQKYYRKFRRHVLLRELRIPLADAISEFSYICKSLDEELEKIETYSSNLPSCGNSTNFMSAE